MTHPSCCLVGVKIIQRGKVMHTCLEHGLIMGQMRGACPNRQQNFVIGRAKGSGRGRGGGKNVRGNGSSTEAVRTRRRLLEIVDEEDDLQEYDDVDDESQLLEHVSASRRNAVVLRVSSLFDWYSSPTSPAVCVVSNLSSHMRPLRAGTR